MTAPVVVDHRPRIVRTNTVPGLETHQFVCSCGAASPESVDKYVAIIARRSHLSDVRVTTYMGGGGR